MTKREREKNKVIQNILLGEIINFSENKKKKVGDSKHFFI